MREEKAISLDMPLRAAAVVCAGSVSCSTRQRREPRAGYSWCFAVVPLLRLHLLTRVAASDLRRGRIKGHAVSSPFVARCFPRLDRWGPTPPAETLVFARLPATLRLARVHLSASRDRQTDSYTPTQAGREWCMTDLFDREPPLGIGSNGDTSRLRMARTLGGREVWRCQGPPAFISRGWS